MVVEHSVLGYVNVIKVASGSGHFHRFVGGS